MYRKSNSIQSRREIELKNEKTSSNVPSSASLTMGVQLHEVCLYIPLKLGSLHRYSMSFHPSAGLAFFRKMLRKFERDLNFFVLAWEPACGILGLIVGVRVLKVCIVWMVFLVVSIYTGWFEQSSCVSPLDP